VKTLTELQLTGYMIIILYTPTGRVKVVAMAMTMARLYICDKDTV